MILTILLSLLGITVIVAAVLQAHRADVAAMNARDLFKNKKK